MSRITTGRVAPEVAAKGRVNVRAAVIVDGKPAKGTKSFNIEDTTVEEAMDYLAECEGHSVSLRDIAETSGKSVDELLTALQNQFAPAADESADSAE